VFAPFCNSDSSGLPFGTASLEVLTLEQQGLSSLAGVKEKAADRANFRDCTYSYSPQCRIWRLLMGRCSHVRQFLEFPRG
jgi:hypothetical protein